MCGIAGIVKFSGDINSEKNVLENMVKIQRHRGPDDSGSYFDNEIALGHSRLAIIDLSGNAHQPMTNEDKTKWIIHNGEIYNYIELREELVKLGHSFKSASDTEVILHAFEEWGEEALRRFNGMWAFAIWDSKKRSLFMSRDRFGVKPFYYYRDKGSFIFSSEIKAILATKKIKKKPNDRAIFDYLITGYGYMDIADYTFFEGIYKLKPGHYMKLSIPENKTEYKKYWDIGDDCPDGSQKNEKYYVDRFYEIFESSIKLRLRSDVDVGVALSGGLDSSSIACVAQKAHKPRRLLSFSSCFEEDVANERKFIDDVLKKTDLEAHFTSADPNNLFNDLESIIYHQEEPYSTASILPQWYVMKAAHEKGVKVLLAGQGGDETLAGYHKYYPYLFADLIKSLKWKQAFKEIGYYKKIKGKDSAVSKEIAKVVLSDMLPAGIKNALSRADRRFPSYLAKDFAKEFEKFTNPKKKFKSILNNDLYNAFKVSPLPALLHIDDRSGMAHSVETRSPFLDYRLVEFAFSIPSEYKIRHGRTKYILRQAMSEVLPESLLNRQDKMGFPAPLGPWLRGPLKEKTYDILNSKEFTDRPYFNGPLAVKEFDLNIKRGKQNDLTIWSWLNLELWLRKYIDSDEI